MKRPEVRAPMPRMATDTLKFGQQTGAWLTAYVLLCATALAAPLPPDIVWQSNAHSNFVNGVAISPDGSLFASASGDRTIRLWRLANGTPVRLLTGHSDLVNAVAFSQDGSLLASGSADQTVKIWRVSDGVLLHTLFGHTEFVSSVAFSPDGSALVSASGDTSLRLWRVGDGALLRILYGHISSVWSVDFSPDGTLLASGSGSFFDAPGTGENNIKLWNVTNGTVLRTLEGHSADVWSVKFSPDGSLLASGSGDKSIKLWRVVDGVLQRTLTGHSSQVLCVAFAPDATNLISGSHSPDNTLKFWHVADGALLQSYNQETYFINSIAFAPDGRLFGYGRDDNYVVVARNPYPPTGSPRITVQPRSQTVLCRSNVTFIAAAIGSAPLSYQWLFNGIPVTAATNPVVTLTNIGSSDSGNYRLAVSNTTGTNSSAEAILNLLDTNGPIALAIWRTGTNLVMSWPATCADYDLEGTSFPGTPTNWTPESTRVSFSNGTFTVLQPLGSTNRFLRLKRRN